LKTLLGTTGMIRVKDISAQKNTRVDEGGKITEKEWEGRGNSNEPSTRKKKKKKMSQPRSGGKNRTSAVWSARKRKIKKIGVERCYWAGKRGLCFHNSKKKFKKKRREVGRERKVVPWRTVTGTNCPEIGSERNSHNAGEKERFPQTQ